MGKNVMWILFALLAALAGAVVAILTKVGLKNVDSNLGMAVQSVLILVICWGVVMVQGNLGDVAGIDWKAWVCLLLAGVITSASYLLLFKALKLGEASRVVPVDRLSLIIAILLGAIFLKEKLTVQVMLGGGLMTVGALLIACAGK
jgi:bacterial/archaeal transporter family protein